MSSDLHLKPRTFKVLQVNDGETKFRLSTNHRPADQLKVISLGEQNVES